MSKIAAALVFALVAGPAHAATIVPFSVDPALIGSPRPAGAYDAFSSGLNGTLLSGQRLSLDLVYADGMLARVLGATSIDVGLALSTNATFSCQQFPGFQACGNWPGFPTDVTGYLLAPDGSALTPPRAGGSAQSSDGVMFPGFTGVTSPTPGGANWELSGAHLEFGLPNTGFEVTDAALRLIVRSGTVQFGTAQQLADGDSLVPIAALGVIGAAPLRSVSCPSTTSSAHRALVVEPARVVGSFPLTASAAGLNVCAARSLPWPRAPLSAVRIARWSRSENFGVLRRPFGLPD